MLWMRARDKCIEISLITRSHQHSPSWMAQPSGYLKAQNPAVNPGLLSCPVKADPAGQEGRTAACLPGPSALCWVAEPRGLGSLCQLVLWQRHSLDHTSLLPLVIAIIQADVLVSWCVTLHTFNLIAEASPSWLVFMLASLPEDSLCWNPRIDKPDLFFFQSDWQAQGNVQIISNAQNTWVHVLVVCSATSPHFWAYTVLPTHIAHLVFCGNHDLFLLTYLFALIHWFLKILRSQHTQWWHYETPQSSGSNKGQTEKSKR